MLVAAICSLAAPSEPLPAQQPMLPLALKQQLQEAEWDAGERREEVALIAAGRGSEGEGMYGSPLLGERAEPARMRTHHTRFMPLTTLCCLPLTTLCCSQRRFLDRSECRGTWQTAECGGAAARHAG